MVIPYEDHGSRGMTEGFYEAELLFADIDGDGGDEILARHLVSITGGRGRHETTIYQLSKGRLEKLFSNLVERKLSS